MRRRVYLNPNGVITLDSDLFGKRKRLSTGRKPGSKKEAERLIAWYLKNFDDEYSELYGAGRPTSGVLFREYGADIVSITSENRNRFSQEEAESALERLCEMFGDKCIDSITKSDCQRWQNEMAKSYSGNTINKKWRSLLNVVFDYAVSDGLIDRNPLFKLPKAKGLPAKEKVFLYENDFPKLFARMNEEERDRYAVALFTGVRGGEFIALRWDDILFDKGVIKVDTRIREGEEAKPKTEAGERVLPMTQHVYDALKRQYLRTGHQEFVWLTYMGKPYTNHAVISTKLKKISAEAGLPPVTLKVFRASYNTLLKNKGYRDDIIFQWIGHTGPQVNTNHYTGTMLADMGPINEVSIEA
ncbi:tyrosine-type recombinase/integrase [Sulfurimonas sp. HSL1-6]|uniref:tyrosine-type recombinase/integrase n=1 Tax=Thiomicrolovo immobilis TaxID=3131935 RepID=UPI0031F8B33F